ncbi:MarR family transcriptional regulator [uncultured Paenibacillus sp.]|uniref:MarR family winged helix-turn-helix transcriptional regulator n=1 Tax=uncultured Paenibacillus sp. TaxID=227322 RepID=UPI0015B3282D|nr:MarR family transcriptional regulator [uncultured Paenibacillus sp.]
MVKREELFEVTSMFRTLIKAITQEWNKRGGEFNLSFPQYKMLYMLNASGTHTVSQLAEALGITSAAITGITDRLVTEGFVNRERGENDRRVVNISITDRGREIISQVTERQKEMLEGMFDQLQEEDLQHLRRIFGVVLANIDNNL